MIEMVTITGAAAIGLLAWAVGAYRQRQRDRAVAFRPTYTIRRIDQRGER